jgi:hypothetical protein
MTATTFTLPESGISAPVGGISSDQWTFVPALLRAGTQQPIQPGA